MVNVILAGSNPQDFDAGIVGGKGLNLLGLFNIAQQTGMFEVPDYFIIPTNAKRHYSNTNDGTRVIYQDREIENAFERLRKPIVVRSSSPLEDGLNASFAGMFNSFRDVKSYDEMILRANDVYQSALQERVKKYSGRMGIEFSDAMALIIQEQVKGASEWGIMQLDDYEAVTEAIDKRGRELSTEIEYMLLDEFFPKGFKWEKNPESKTSDSIGEGDFHYAAYCAREAKERLNLEGVVQVEFFLLPANPPRFVQIRQLPKIRSYMAELDMDIPEGVPYIESQVCNDVAGELVLPAYVTTSQSGITKIMVETGQAFLLGIGSRDSVDERTEKFNKNSNLAENHDYNQIRSLAINQRFMGGLEDVLSYYNEVWKKGNALFNEYILVCDKLDETICEMTDATTNKKAIITCLEAKKTSHAMTVARDLGIMYMGVNGDLYDLEPRFFHQVETGDIIHMKSDGRRAVAYIEKKRASDPYIK
jgi:hypothetical protein